MAVQAQIKNSPTIWGCDLCQRACPWNREAALSPLPEFRQNLLPSLTLAELEELQAAQPAVEREPFMEDVDFQRAVGPGRSPAGCKGQRP